MFFERILPTVLVFVAAGWAACNADLMLGAYADIETSDTGLNEAITNIMESLRSNVKSNLELKVGSITSAQQQIVSGIKYKVEVRLNHETSGEVIKYQDCTLEIWVQSWTNKNELLSHHCNKPEFQPLQTNEMPGGRFRAEVTDEGILSSARFGVTHLQSTANSPVVTSFVRVVEATSQVVGGYRHSLIVELNVTLTGETTPTLVKCYMEVLHLIGQDAKMEKYECDADTFTA